MQPDPCFSKGRSVPPHYISLLPAKISLIIINEKMLITPGKIKDMNF